MKLLWVGDAVTQTGFARVTHNVLKALADKWDVHVIGLNYFGDPHSYPYKIYPAVLGGDSHGVGRLKSLIRSIKPDVVMILNDPWIVRDYLTQCDGSVPVVAYMPVDAPNQDSAGDLGQLGLARAIAYTNFGKKELQIGGYPGQIDVIAHGVDIDLYKPQDRDAARSKLRFKADVNPSDLFIVGNVNRNMPRKRLDLTIQYWTEWWIRAGQPKEAYLYLHCSNRDEGWDVIKLARYYGIEKNFILTNPNMTSQNCMNEKDMPTLYSMFDVQLTTSLGEGWGLTTHEGMACGIPQILPRYSALGEWANGAAHFVDCTSFSVTPKGINTIGGVADQEQVIDAIDKFYRDVDYRKTMAKNAWVRAREDRFNWGKIGEQFHLALLETVVAYKPIKRVEAPQA